MANKNSKQPAKDTGLILVISFVLFFAVNSLVICLGSRFFPSQIVLGTANISRLWAVIHSATTLALINTFTIPFIREYEKRKQKTLTNLEWMVLYFALNFVSVWLIARLADQLGFGIKSWLIALGLATVLDLMQGATLMTLESSRDKLNI